MVELLGAEPGRDDPGMAELARPELGAPETEPLPVVEPLRLEPTVWLLLVSGLFSVTLPELPTPALPVVLQGWPFGPMRPAVLGLPVVPGVLPWTPGFGGATPGVVGVVGLVGLVGDVVVPAVPPGDPMAAPPVMPPPPDTPPPDTPPLADPPADPPLDDPPPDDCAAARLAPPTSMVAASRIAAGLA